MNLTEQIALFERTVDEARENAKELRALADQAGAIADQADKSVLLLAAQARKLREVLGDPAPARAPERPALDVPAAAPVAPVTAPAAPAVAPAPGSRSAVENVLALDAAGLLARGSRGDDGRLVFTQYGGPTDRTPDANTARGIGNRNNRLRATSLALAPNLIRDYGLKGGEEVHLHLDVQTYFLGHYDDTTGAHDKPNVIDVYDPADRLGRDTFMRIVPAGRWHLVTGAPVPDVPNAGAWLARAARAMVGQPFTYHPDTDGGALGCADVVSTALERAGIIQVSEHQIAVAGLSALLRERYGWRATARPYRDGDVIVWGPFPGGKHGHIGVIVLANDGAVHVVHNSSTNRRVMKMNLAGYDRPITMVLRAPAAAAKE